MDTMKFVWLCGAFLTFWISLLLLCMFWKSEMLRLAGFYAIVPGISLLIMNGLPWWISFKIKMAILAASEFFSYFLRCVFFTPSI
jgi:hypothetical protein